VATVVSLSNHVAPLAWIAPTRFLVRRYHGRPDARQMRELMSERGIEL
jgi:hypothetical protein